MLARLRQWRERRRFLQAVLKEVNAIRAEHGMGSLKRMPKGCRHAAYRRPVATALKTSVGPVGYGSPSRPLPPTLRTFVKRFDRGDFPHLIIERTH